MCCIVMDVSCHPWGKRFNNPCMQPMVMIDTYSRLGKSMVASWLVKCPSNVTFG